MANFVFRLPDIGEGVAEAEVTAWYVKPGDAIAEDAPLLDVMTDKATVEMTTPVAGRIVAIHGAVGDRVPVGSPLVEIEREGGENSAGGDGKETGDAAPAPPAPAPAPAETAPAAASPPPAPPKPLQPPFQRDKEGVETARPLAAPAVRQRAAERGIPLEKVGGTGPEGRITDADLDRYRDARSGSSAAARTAVEEVPVIGLRRRIAEKMAEAKSRIPHFTYIEEFDLTELESLRKTLNEDAGEGQPKLTLLPFFMRALVKVLPAFPTVNARFDDERNVLSRHAGIHIGIATNTDSGLMVPVVRHAEARNLWDCAAELVRVTKAARDGKATREELSNSTITLTSLGALGGIAATPVINHPEVAIIGPNKLQDRPVVRGGEIVIRTMMNVSSSFDHRIVDGYEAAKFINVLKRLIETPALIFVEPPRAKGA